MATKETKRRNLYNPSTDDRVNIPFNEILPAHVSKLELRKLKKGENDLYIYSLSYKIAEEVSNLSFKHEVTGASVAGSRIAGRYINGKGIFFEPEATEGWKNSNYKTAFKDALGVDFPVEVIGDVEYLVLDRDGEVITELEVIGKPCLVKTVKEKYTDKNGVEQTIVKVGDIYPNPSGKVLPAELVKQKNKEDDAPF